jgi:hypothetical protein
MNDPQITWYFSHTNGDFNINVHDTNDSLVEVVRVFENILKASGYDFDSLIVAQN